MNKTDSSVCTTIQNDSVQMHPKLKVKIPSADLENPSEVWVRDMLKEELSAAAEKTAKEYGYTKSGPESDILAHLGEYIEEPFSIIESYFRGQHLERLARHQIESYNHFINFQVLRTIQMFNPVNIRSENDYVAENGKYTLEIFVSFENFKLLPPQIHENNGATKLMLPQEAKLRNFTYASTMYIDLNIQYIIRNTEKMDSPKIINTILPKINIGKMPIMMKSSICVLTQNSHISHKFTGECPMDCGGYFIIKGSEKTVLGQERAAENRVYCFDGKNTTKWDWFAEIKSVPDFKCISPKQIEMMIASKNNGFGNPIYVTIPRIKQPIELFVLYRALGIMVDKQICQYIVLDIDGDKYADVLKFLEASIIDANKYMTQEDALRHITASVAYTPINMDKETGGRKKREFAMDVLNNDLFPHCKTLKQKLYLLGYMANKLIQTRFGWKSPDDRDSYLNKRIDLTGTLLNNLFRNYFNKLVKEMQKQVIREINNGSWRSTEDYENIINMTNIYKIIKSTTIENGITRALATGDFSIKQANSTKVGVAQVLTRLTYMSCLSHIRRINTPLEKSGELIAPRKLHNTSFGFLCCFTGDTEILLANQMDTICIKDLANSDLVTTINPANLLAEPSPIHSWFRKMPDKLYKLTLNNGISIKATPDHKFLTVQRNGKYLWKELKDLCPIKDRIVVRHTVRHIPFVASEQRHSNICIFDSGAPLLRQKSACDQTLSSRIPPNEDDLEIGDHILQYITELKKLGYIGRNIPAYKLRILARLIGALNANGILYQLGFTSLHQCQPNNTEYKAIFRVFCESGCEAIDTYSVKQILADIAELGFTLDQDNTSLTPAMSRNDFEYMSNTHEIHIYGAFAYLLYKLGAILGKDKVNVYPYNPDWIVNGEPAIKREYLSGIQGQITPQVYYDSYTDKVAIGAFVVKTRNTIEFLKKSRTYLNEIKQMFADLGIESRLYQNNIPSIGGAEGLKNKFTNLSLRFKQSAKNIITYVDTIYHAYNDTLRIQCASAIELIKTRYYHRYECGNDMYNILSNSQKMGWSYHKSIDIEYVNKNCLENGCIASPIYSMTCIEPEYVYDFTTQSQNHSFVASSFVAHNCSESPEGGSIGVVKNISYMAHITIPTNSASLYEYVEPYIINLEDVPSKDLYEKIKVFVNGAWVGVAIDPMELYTEMKNKKYKGIINIYTSIVFDFKLGEIRICSDGGRLTRPLLKIRDGKAIITRDVIQRLEKGELNWNDLLTNCKLDESVIEYIDPEEQNFAMIAMKSKTEYLHDLHVKINYTHCEIHPSTIFGVLASCAPYPDHNQAPRVTYQCAMVKQAIGIYTTNFDQRMDKSAYILNYPSRPLVDTRLMNFIHLNKVPSGCQVHVAIASFSGYNQEDSVLINSGSIDRGLFSATIYHTEKDEDKNIIRDEIIRCKPDPTKTKCIKFGNYNKLNSQGFIPENSLVENRDIIIAKIIPIKENRNDPTKTIKYEDQSKSFRTTEETYIDKNYTGRNGDGYNFAKVRVRTFRKPVIGDKLACFKKNCDVLSSEGWIPIENVTLKHKVCILDPETDNIHYEYPSEIHCYDYDSETHGKLYQMKSSLVELTVTHNHRMWVKKRAVLENNKYDYKPNYEFIEAKDCFGKRLKYKKSASNFQPDNWIGDTFIIPSFTDGNKLIRPEIKVDTNDWLVFFGIWLAEGYSNKNQVGIAAHKPRVKAALEPVIQRMGFNVCKSKIKTSEIANNWVINNVQLCNLMKTYSVGAIHKYLPEWVWRLNKEQSRLLITSMMLGDGHISNANNHIYYTSSEKLADDLSRLCLHAGWAAHKRNINSKMAGTTTTIKGTNRTITSNVDHMCVTIIKTKLEPEMNHGHKKTQNGQSEEWIDYKGTVHCLTVRTGIFMVRQNGKPVWSGNSRSAQKGTVGNIIPECDMPFTKDGLRPDIILNPHAIPSRMTIGQLKETLLGKVLLELGLFGDGTSFGDLNIHTITEELQRLGYESYGNEILYNGSTGEQLETSIFFGPVFYQRLKHMVNDKQHSRSIGPMVNLTHQPAEGRSRDGGFRIGEMERDVLCSHGMTKFTRERLFDVSDKYTTNICKKCGMIACFNDGDKNRKYANNDFSIHLCRTCGNKTDFALVEMPYANKLLFQELQTINVAPRVITE